MDAILPSQGDKEEAVWLFIDEKDDRSGEDASR